MTDQTTQKISTEQFLAIRDAAIANQNGGSFAELLEETREGISGRRIVDTEDLKGVPFIITGLTFRTGKGGDFVSVEATAADANTLANVVKQGRTKAATVEFLPVVGDEQFVFNDSSTGIRRQLVKWLNDTGRITVDPEWDAAAHDKADVLDQPIQDKNGEDVWLHGVQEALDGFTGLRYLCARGTRVSQYDYQGDQARTVYLA